MLSDSGMEPVSLHPLMFLRQKGRKEHPIPERARDVLAADKMLSEPGDGSAIMVRIPRQAWKEKKQTNAN